MLWGRSSRINDKYPDLNEEISIGEFAVHGQGSSLTIISYGNGFYLSMKARVEIEKPHALRYSRTVSVEMIAERNDAK